MKRIICWMSGIVFLFTMGCAGAGLNPASQKQTANAFADTFSQAIAQQGFSLGPVAKSSGDDSVAYGVFSDAFSDGTRVWFEVQEADQAVQAAGIEFYHPENKPADLNAYLTLSQTLLQICNPSTIPDQAAAAKTLKEIFQSCMQGDMLEKKGFHYAAFGGGVDAAKFVVMYPGYDEEDVEIEQTKTIQGTKALPFTAEAVAATFGTFTAKSQISVKPVQPSMSAIPELANLPKEGSPKVYALEHALGITVGWLVCYSSDAGLVQLDYVERNDGDENLYVIQLDLPDALVQACDPILSAEDTKENHDKARDIASDFFYHDPLTENGIQYQEYYEDGVSFIVVTKQ